MRRNLKKPSFGIFSCFKNDGQSGTQIGNLNKDFQERTNCQTSSNQFCFCGAEGFPSFKNLSDCAAWLLDRFFSKIGSQPELHKENLNELIENVCGYFEKRLPHLGRKVEIVRTYSTNIITRINPELFAWVIENLIKNSAEAIENKNGKIKIDVIKTKSKIIINFNDNGKGMSLQQRRQAFYPGFTTKKRGWGLGLSLCKRIVVEYHKGKIYIKDTSPSKGTTFTVELPHKNIS